MTNKLANIFPNDSQIKQHQGRSTDGDSTGEMYVALYNIALCFVTAPGNGLLLLALCADPIKYFRTPNSFLVISMTFANLITGIVVEPPTAALSFSKHYKVVTPPIVSDLYKAFLCTPPNASFFYFICVVSGFLHRCIDAAKIQVCGNKKERFAWNCCNLDIHYHI